jgi:ethylbenzene dehydrogenase
MSTYRGYLKTLSLIAVSVTLVSCTADDDPLPMEPTDEVAEVTYSVVQNVLTEDCSGCHSAGGGRAFTVDMDSTALISSGLIDPGNPDASLILTKPRSASAHGGGIVEGFTDADITQIKEWVVMQPMLNLNVLEAVPMGSRVRPNNDGYPNEAVWYSAPKLITKIGGGWADAEEVVMSAAYNDEYLYILAQWVDDEESVRRAPWVKQSDGSWKTMSPKPAPADGVDWMTYMGANFDEEGPNLFYEDKLAVIWNTYGASTIAGFDEQGCAVICHDPANNYGPGTTYNYTDQNLAAKKYTNAAAEIGDIWHWKLVRQNQHYKIDDQYVKFWTQGGPDPAHAGRSADTGSGGYSSNPATNGMPTYRGTGGAANPYYILDSDKVELTVAELDAMPVGSAIANMITKGPNDTRADVDAHGVYNPGNQTWTLEIRRRLITGDSQDVQFDDLARDYAFGVAIFDNAQIEHSWSGQPYKLRFVQN